MTIRALICCIFLASVAADGAHAQAPSNSPGVPSTGGPAIDGTVKTPNTPAPVPEVIAPPGQHGDVIRPSNGADATAVLKPPDVDPAMRVQPPADPDRTTKANPK
jgi:hypothetical protein